MVGTGSEQNLSKTAEDCNALPFKVLHNGREVPGSELPMQRAAREGVEILDQELEIAREDGTVIHELCRATPLRDESGGELPPADEPRAGAVEEEAVAS